MKTYRTRQERLDYLQVNFSQFLQGKVLDVGCNEAYLRPYLGPSRYIGVDLIGNVDVQVNLEDGVLPFAGSIFDCVVCLDVLEHLEEIHSMFPELIRVTRGYAIVSLPNPFAQYWPLFFRGGGNADKYGLPPDRPPDRHRWFFNYDEAKTFLITMAHRNNARILRIVPIPIVEDGVFWKVAVKQLLRRLMAPKGDKYLNFSTQSIWALMEKQR
jgi:SAM-dependent methyltransferase